MNLTKDFFSKVIDFGEEWIVTSVESDHLEKVIYLDIKYIGSYKDPNTLELANLYDHAPERLWRHLDIVNYKCYIRSKIPRVKCSDGKVKQINIEWANTNDRHTLEFEIQVIDLLKITFNQTKTAEYLNCDFKLVNRVLRRSTDRGLARRDLSKQRPTHLGIDEKSFKKGHKYITVLTHSVTGSILDVAEGRDENSVKDMINNTFSVNQIKEINTISMDMWKPFLNVANKIIPNAEIVHDRFHLVKYLNDAVDKVRKREVKDNEELKKTKFIFLKNRQNLTEYQREKFSEINNLNFSVTKAWGAKENFKSLFNVYNEYHSAKQLYDDWSAYYRFINIPEINKVIDMFARHIKGVINSLTASLSNAVAERLNGKIQLLKSIGRGYKTFDNFRNAILFFHGKLNLYP